MNDAPEILYTEHVTPQRQLQAALAQPLLGSLGAAHTTDIQSVVTKKDAAYASSWARHVSDVQSSEG